MVAEASKVTEFPLHKTSEGRPEVKFTIGTAFVSTVTVTVSDVAKASEFGHFNMLGWFTYTNRR